MRRKPAKRAQTLLLLLSWICMVIVLHYYAGSEIQVHGASEMPSAMLPVVDTVDNSPWPRIAWLMSFPTSGTSFTHRLVQEASGQLVGTNYLQESRRDINDEPLLIKNNTRGPFWCKLGGEKNTTVPTTYVLTKTHCGGTNERNYILESPNSFLSRCASESKNLRDWQYNNGRVRKAVHLIRNPFDNIVSRFHLASGLRTANVSNFEKSRKGFRDFCSQKNQKHWRENKKSQFVNQLVLRRVETVPCYIEFFKYIQWHNLAFIATDDLMDIPTLVLHYEDYESQLELKIQALLDFLELPRNSSKLPGFKSGKSYLEYYTTEERERMKTGMKMLATKRTWKGLERYFQ